MADDLWKKCPIHGWAKLNRQCDGCGKEKADIEIMFMCSGLPDGYMKSGQFARSWHWQCLPPELKRYQSADEAAMWQEVQTPFGL